MSRKSVTELNGTCGILCDRFLKNMYRWFISLEDKTDRKRSYSLIASVADYIIITSKDNWMRFHKA